MSPNDEDKRPKMDQHRTDADEPPDEPLQIAWQGAKSMGTDWRTKDFSDPEILRAAFVEVAEYSKAAIQGGSRLTKDIERRDSLIYLKIEEFKTQVAELELQIGKKFIELQTYVGEQNQSLMIQITKATDAALTAADVAGVVGARLHAYEAHKPLDERDMGELFAEVRKWRQWREEREKKDAEIAAELRKSNAEIERVKGDVNHSQSRPAMSETSATKELELKLKEERIEELEEEVKSLRKREEKKGEIEVQHRHDWTKFGADKLIYIVLAVLGFILAGLIYLVIYLLVHPNPFVH